MASESDFISRTRQTVTEILEAFYARWGELYAQYQALGYGTALVDEDFVGENSDLTAQQFKDAVAALNNVKAALDGNSPTLWPLKK